VAVDADVVVGRDDETVLRGFEPVEFAGGVEAIAAALNSDSFIPVWLAAFLAADMCTVRAVNNDDGQATACMYT
jgi:hypothetical protein